MPQTRRISYSLACMGVFILIASLLTSFSETAAADEPSRTLFGASVSLNNGETFTQAVARQDRNVGKLQILRVYNGGLPKSWSSEPAVKTGRPLVISFKDKPNTINAGKRDAFFEKWFAAAPTDRDIYWVYYHEPEDNIRNGEFTTAAYRTAFAHLDAIADRAHNPKLHTTQVLMDWTLDKKSGRDWRDYYPGKDVIDVQAWDSYNYYQHGSFLSMDAMQKERPSYDVTRAEGNQFAIAEIGDAEKHGRPQWLSAVGAWSRAHQAAFVTYFDSAVGGDFRLTDTASQKAWGDVIRKDGVAAS